MRFFERRSVSPDISERAEKWKLEGCDTLPPHLTTLRLEGCDTLRHLTEEVPLPLVRRAPAGEVEAPLPLTRRRDEVASDGEPLALTPKPRAVSGRERRVAVRREVEIEIGIQSDTNFYTGFSCDISSGGLFVATYDVPAIGTAVNVNFRLPGGPVMSLDGAVRWVRDLDPRDPDMVPGMGVAFAVLTPDQARAINAFLAVRQPIFYED